MSRADARGVDVNRVSAVLTRLIETGKPVSTVDQTTGEVVPLSPRLAASPHGFLPVFLAAATRCGARRQGAVSASSCALTPTACSGSAHTRSGTRR